MPHIVANTNNSEDFDQQVEKFENYPTPETSPEYKNFDQSASLETKNLNEKKSLLDEEENESNSKNSQNNDENKLTSNNENNKVSSSTSSISRPEQITREQSLSKSTITSNN